jgi:SAM-dependent methyltransferase
MTSRAPDSNDKIFAHDEAFWNNYLKGRPKPPQSFFDRIYYYHEQHGGKFGTAHDVGAGNGPYSAQLRSRFDHVIVSDIVAENVRFAESRLGTDGFSYRAAKVEEADDIPEGSVDLVFATNVLHFVDQNVALEAIAKQLRSGGTFAGAGFGPALFNDTKVQDVWTRISQRGGRVLLKKADQPQQTIRIMKRSEGNYNNAPLDEKLFLPGAQRVHLNMEKGGITGLLPPEFAGEFEEPVYTGPKDVEVFENEGGWSFDWELKDLKEHFGSFPHSKEDPEAFVELWNELNELLKHGSRLDGVFPAKLILATRR